MRPGKIEKAKDFKGSLTKLLKYLKPFYALLVLAIILALVGSIFSIIGPDKIKEITNLIVLGLKDGIDLVKIKKIALFLIIIYLIGAVSSYVEHFIMATITNKFTKKLRNEISIKINKLPLKYFDNTTYGDVLSRVTNDVDTMSNMLSQSVGTLVSSITLLIGSVFMMFYTNYILALVSIFASLFGFLFMVIVLAKSQKYFSKFQEELGELNGHIEETYSGHDIIKTYNGIDLEVKEFDKINNQMFNDALKSHFFSGLMHPFMGFIGNLSYVLVCVVGSYLAINGVITFGVIVAFTIYARLFSSPLTQIAQVATSLQSAGAASERVFEFLDLEGMPEEADLKDYLNPLNVKGDIEFKHVKFGYDDSKDIIKDFSCHIKSGEKVAIVGPTGAGKTTIVKLLMRFYELNDGNIFIDDINIKYLKRKDLRSSFGMVLQDTWLFNGTIRENLKYGNLDATDEEMIKASKDAYVHHFIETQSDSYNMVLNEETNNISGGQKQLLTIARVILADPKILILDEATSSVDTRTEVLIQKAMDRLMEGRTSFIIAHRLSTIKNADVILVVNNGEIIEQGKHETLLKKNGFYANLYNSQFTK